MRFKYKSKFSQFEPKYRKTVHSRLLHHVFACQFNRNKQKNSLFLLPTAYCLLPDTDLQSSFHDLFISIRQQARFIISHALNVTGVSSFMLVTAFSAQSIAAQDQKPLIDVTTPVASSVISTPKLIVSDDRITTPLEYDANIANIEDSPTIEFSNLDSKPDSRYFQTESPKTRWSKTAPKGVSLNHQEHNQDQTPPLPHSPTPPSQSGAEIMGVVSLQKPQEYSFSEKLTETGENQRNLIQAQQPELNTPVTINNDTNINNQVIDEILNQLENLPVQQFVIPIERGYLSSPALTISNPNGYGADRNTIFASASYQRRTRFTKTNDGELGLGIGIGDSVKSVGVELAYTLNTFGTSQDFGSGAFSIKVHRRISEDFAVAAGWNQFARILINPRVNFDYPENSYYAVATKVFKTQPYISQPFSRVAVTAGIGSGQFLPFDQIQEAVANDEAPTGLNVFGSLSVRVLRPVSAIIEWTGQDLGVGLSIVPFKNIPLVITPAVRDITGAGDGARFIMGAGVAIQL